MTTLKCARQHQTCKDVLFTQHEIIKSTRLSLAVST